MTEPGDLKATHAYTRGEVEAYLQAVADQSATYRAAIAEAHARTERAIRLERRIVELERRVGQSIVSAHAEARSGALEHRSAPENRASAASEAGLVGDGGGGRSGPPVPDAEDLASSWASTSRRAGEDVVTASPVSGYGGDRSV